MFKDCKGFSLIEMFVVVSILTAMITGVSFILSAGQTAWFNTDTAIELQDGLRKAFAKMSRELQESGRDKNGNMQVTIFDGSGPNGSDIIRFSMPILCQAGGNVIDANGDVANWGAPLTWGCTSSSCMDADNDCLTRDYRFIEYQIVNNQLIRRVLDNGTTPVRQDTIARNMVNLQATLSGDQNLLSVNLTAQQNTVVNRTLNASTNIDIYFRNRG